MILVGLGAAHAAPATVCPETNTGISLSPGSDGKGSPVGADLTAGTWLWSDGSLEGLTKTISQGVATPKKHLGAMPPLGGSPLSAADLKAVSAYVWSIGHPQ
jgi:mono/diheme cytochrome c family protein